MFDFLLALSDLRDIGLVMIDKVRLITAAHIAM